MSSERVRAMVQDVRRYGAELILNAEGLLELRQGQHVPLALQQQIGRHRFEIVELLCREACYQLADDQLTRLRQSVATGELDAVSGSLWAWPGVEIPGGEAGRRAGFWLRWYDAGYDRKHAERLLRGLYYGASLSWRQSAVEAAP